MQKLIRKQQTSLKVAALTNRDEYALNSARDTEYHTFI